MNIQHRTADLSIYPNIIKHQHTHVSIGDLHGNALKLIYILIEENVLGLNQQQYDELKTIYSKNVNELTADDLSKFEHIINGAAVNKTKAVTLVGDELADRGRNDYFTLLVLKKLHSVNFNINIMLSNHGVEFIRDYERINFTGNSTTILGQTGSLQNMQTLIKMKLVDEKHVRDIVDQCYKPMVHGIGYTLSPEGEITLFTHAPIGLETIQGIAKKFNIDYRDDSIRNFIHTIDEINQAIRFLFNKKKLAQEILSEGKFFEQKGPIPLNHPLQRLIWNRFLGNELVTEPKGGFNVNFVHGHVGPYSVRKNGSEDLPKHLNLDNLFGKSEACSKTSLYVNHFTRQSSEMTSRELTEEKLKKISFNQHASNYSTDFSQILLTLL